MRVRRKEYATRMVWGWDAVCEAQNQKLKPIRSRRQGTAGAVWRTGFGVRLPGFSSLALLLPGCVDLNMFLILSKPQFY